MSDLKTIHGVFCHALQLWWRRAYKRHFEDPPLSLMSVLHISICNALLTFGNHYLVNHEVPYQQTREGVHEWPLRVCTFF